MDFILDYISVSTFWTILFIIHALLAVALLGALTHQAMSVLMPVRQGAAAGNFVTRFRAVQGAGYATAVCVAATSARTACSTAQAPPAI